MITTAKLSKDRYDVFHKGKCIGDFSRKYGEEFYFFPIQFTYNTAWDQKLLRAVADALAGMNLEIPPESTID
jgi:hypothetical protein